MTDLIKILESFNRKERYFLIAQALGKPQFELSDDFREELCKKVGLKEKGIEIPDDAFVAMDYHLDWIAAGLQYFEAKEGVDSFDNLKTFEGEGFEAIEGTQGDIDLLVAFFSDKDQKCHLVLVEAKAFTDPYWTDVETAKQICKKIKRLKQIFGIQGKNYEAVNVTAHFCVVGPAEPNWQRMRPSPEFPEWMIRRPQNRIPWLRLSLPESRLLVERKDKTNGSFKRFRILSKRSP